MRVGSERPIRFKAESGTNVETSSEIVLSGSPGAGNANVSGTTPSPFPELAGACRAAR